MTKRNQSRAQTTTQQNDAPNSNKPDDAQSTITLKQLLTDRKIKTDPKLIRRVLRKYYTSKINHQHRDAWVFPTDHADNVVALIDKHCRAAKSA